MHHECFLHFTKYIIFSIKIHLKFVVQSKAYQTDMPPLFRSLHRDLRLIVRHEYLDIPMHVAKDNDERKKEASKLLCSRRVLSRISRTKEFKSGGEGYGCFYDRLSIRPSPDSHSLLRCILVWRSTRISLSHPTISKPATRSQLMARVPRSPSMANIRSAQSFPRFSSQFFFFFSFSMFEFLDGRGSKMYCVNE